MTELVLSLGLPLALTVFLLIQIIKDPNKIDQYKSIVVSPFYRIGRWGSRTYIGSKISYQINEFFNRHIIRNIANQNNVDVKVHWVTSESDPILNKDNAIIVCLKKDKDQARNILNAASQAIPVITHKHLRSNIDSDVMESIDLTTLRNLATKLGNHGRFAFKHYFLTPKCVEHQRVAEMFEKLVRIDNRGYFVPIFLNELEYISDGIYANGDLSDHTGEVIDFIEFLISISDIEVGNEVKQWNYFSSIFNAGIILLANNQRMIKQGVKPYVDRITKNLKQGYESIYILAEENSWEFLKRYEQVLEDNDRVLIKGHYTIEGIVANDPKRKSKVKIVLLRKIDVFVDDLFKEQIDASEIAVGKTITGKVVDVSNELAIVNAMGIDAYIRKNECSWYNIVACPEVLNLNEEREFLVEEIDHSKLSIELSLKFEKDNPWNIQPIPKIGDIHDVHIYNRNGAQLFGRSTTDHNIIIPLNELSWYEPTQDFIEEFIGKDTRVRIYEINHSQQAIKASVCQIDEDPWPAINKSIRPGTEFIGIVTEVTAVFVRVELRDGIIGIIPKERLIEAGGVYTDWKKNVVPGQGIEVVVSRVFIAKRKIHLNLKK